MTQGIVHSSPEPARALANRLAAILQEGQRRYVAVSGGSTPKALFELLATEWRDHLPWDKLTLFQVDERCVPPDHADSNWRVLKETLLDPIPAITAHRMEAETEDGDARYQALLLKHVPSSAGGVPVLDAVLLGMGADGHTASLFPDTAALKERERLVVFNAVPQLQTTRCTITYPLIQAARNRWFLIAGADKLAAFQRARQGELPAGQVRNAEWFTDPAAAGG